jgi:hypothetical protein
MGHDVTLLMMSSSRARDSARKRLVAAPTWVVGVQIDGVV